MDRIESVPRLVITAARKWITRRRLAAGAALAMTIPTIGLSGGFALAGASTSYPVTVFSDGFEAGNLAAWDGNAGTGTAAVLTAAAHSGTYGVRLSNTSGQFSVLVKSLASPVADSSISFWYRVNSAGGVQTLAEARDSSSSATKWVLLYDSGQQGLWFYPFLGSSATEIFTGTNSAPLNTWTQIEVRYSATATGGAQLLVNGATQAAWGTTGNYTSAANIDRVQLWTDVVNSTDFDDVTVATPGSGPSPSPSPSPSP